MRGRGAEIRGEGAAQAAARMERRSAFATPSAAMQSLIPSCLTANPVSWSSRALVLFPICRNRAQPVESVEGRRRLARLDNQ